MSVLDFRALVVGVFVSVAASAAGAEAPEVGPGAMCPDSVSSLSNAVGTVIGCRCPSDGAGASVWGSNPYTADSDFCAAARHAGALSADGGVVWAKISAGLGAYEGSERNGVSSGSYGSYRGSLTIIVDAAAAAATVPEDDLENCPRDMRSASGPLKCFCEPSMLGAGTVWGTDIYTEDSAVCRAALHAGVVTPEGGAVTAVPIAGQQQYTGSERNGVSSRDYGQWDASYIVTP